MRYLVISAAAAMALVGAATVGSAQDEKGKGPGEGKAPGAAQQEPAQQGPSKGDQAPSTPNRAEQPKAPKGAQREPEQQQQKGAQQRDQNKDEPKAAQQRQEPAKDRPEAAQEQRPEPGKDQPKAAQQPGKDKQQSSQPKQEPSKDQPKAAEQKPSQDQPKSAQQEDKQAGSRVQVTEQQRTGVRDRLTKETKVERVQRTKINVTINVGQTIPRSVRLHTLPVTIVSLAPAYRGYSYIVLEDETICVVDSRTYVIVDVIPAGAHRADRPGRAHLALSTEQTRFIFTTVPRNRTANVNVRLALGAEVPRDIELLAFPDDVTRRIPEVARYRYIVTGGDVVIVDPNDHGVALVIND